MDVKQLISDFSIGEKIELYNCLYTDLSGKGLGGDTELAHVNPEEMVVLRAMGGTGTINPVTNLVQFIGGGGGGQQAPAPSVQTSVQQSEFPTELKPFIQDIFGKAQAIQENKEEEGFQAFEGPLQARFDPAQTRSFEQIEAIPGATRPLFDEATTLARSASGPLPTAEELQAASNPFVRNVIDIQKREADRISDVQGQKQDAAASQAGAFGGSRAAILEAERQRNLNQQLGDIEAQGQLAGFQDAQQRIASQRGREASGATQLAALGSAIPAQQLKELGALSGVGAARQTQAQRGIDLARQEFEAEEAFPSQTLQEFSSVLRGFPLAPTRSTTREQFSAAQPLSTQLLGVGTQALGALGASGAFKGAFGQAGGQVGQMPVQKYQGGGALNSLINSTQGLNTQPVVGMGSGGGIQGLLNTHNPMFMSEYHDKMFQGEPDVPPSPGIPAASRVISPEELAKQKDALLRQRAARGQQAAGAGAPRAQASSQTGNQVRQPFKEGGGLSQMVRLPSNRVQFGKTAYANATTDQELAELQRRQDLMGTGEYSSPLTLDITENIINPVVEGYGSAKQSLKDLIGQSSSYLTGKGDSYFKAEGKELRARQEEEIEDAAKQAAALEKQQTAEEESMNALINRNAADKKPVGEDLFLSPEEAGYSSLMDISPGQNAAKRYFAGENVGLANISEALKAYQHFKNTEMGQRRLIDADKRKKATATAKAKRDLLGDQHTMAKIESELGVDAATQAKLIGDQLAALADNGEVTGPRVESLIAQSNAILKKASASRSLPGLIETGTAQTGATGLAQRKRLINEAAKALALAEAAKKG